jgi:RimJ/RimL family protein N-acetyltransferase
MEPFTAAKAKKPALGLVGTRVCLKGLDISDLANVYRWKNDFELSRQGQRHPMPVAELDMETWFQRNTTDPNQVLMGIYWREGAICIGMVRLMFIDWISATAEMGIYIGETEYRGKGIGQESLQLILSYAFGSLRLQKVYLRVLQSNLAAIRLYQQQGFMLEGTLRNHFWNNGQYENVLFMGLLADEYTI